MSYVFLDWQKASDVVHTKYLSRSNICGPKKVLRVTPIRGSMNCQKSQKCIINVSLCQNFLKAIIQKSMWLPLVNLADLSSIEKERIHNIAFKIFITAEGCRPMVFVNSEEYGLKIEI